MSTPPIITNSIAHPEYIQAMHQLDNAYRDYLRIAEAIDSSNSTSKQDYMLLSLSWNSVLQAQLELDRIARQIVDENN